LLSPPEQSQSERVVHEGKQDFTLANDEYSFDRGEAKWAGLRVNLSDESSIAIAATPPRSSVHPAQEGFVAGDRRKGQKYRPAIIARPF
jgi:hypothetical protein